MTVSDEQTKLRDGTPVVDKILRRHREQPHTPRANGSRCRCDLCLVCDELLAARAEAATLRAALERIAAEKCAYDGSYDSCEEAENDGDYTGTCSACIARVALAATPGPLPVAWLDPVTVEAAAGLIEHKPLCTGACMACAGAARIRSLAGQAVPVEVDPVEAIRQMPCPLRHQPGTSACKVLHDIGGDSEPAFCASRIRAALTRKP